MAEIAVQELHKYYGENHVLKGVTFEVYEGEKIGLLGKNGAGKTTLFKILGGVEGSDSGRAVVSGNKKVGVLEQIPDYPMEYSVRDVLKTAFEKQYVLQERMRELETRMESSAEPELLKRYGILQTEFEALGGYGMESEILRVCSGLRMEEMQERPFQLLSGGEKTRVNLGRILLQGTDVLLLDEPTNHLDIRSAEWLEEFLAQYKGSAVIISHDRYFLDKVVKRIIEIVDGQAELYEGNYSYYVQEKEARYLQKLAQYEQEQKKVRQLEEAAKKMHEWANMANNPYLHRRAFSMEKRIERIEKTDKPKKEQGMNSSFRENNFSGKEIIVLDQISKAYEGKPILEAITLTVGKNERIALIGDNGCGKTTLLKIIMGQESPDAGRTKVGDSVRCHFLQQIITFEKPEHTVLEEVRYALEVNEETARNRLAAFHFKGKDITKQVYSLSGGEKSRLRLCILMYGDANLLILDEPTNHLDIRSREWVEEAVSGFKGTILFVSHDRYFINRFATRIWELQEGSIRDYSGTFEEYREWKSKAEIPAVKVQAKEKRIPAAPRQKPDQEKRSAVSTEETEKRIMELEARGRTVELEMEEAVSDYERLASLYEEKDKLTKEIDRLYADWAVL